MEGCDETLPRVGIVGARSLVGQCLLDEFAETGTHVVAWSRNKVHLPVAAISDMLEWRVIGIGEDGVDVIENWVWLAPIWTIPEYTHLLESHGVKRILALSSVSLFSKSLSPDVQEQALAKRLKHGESALIEWARSFGVAWTILRPTMIYGRGQDRNITRLSNLIKRWEAFPIVGAAEGMRQPVHAEDVAHACRNALQCGSSYGKCYTISGGEELSYVDMLGRLFEAQNLPSRFISIPIPLFRFIKPLLRVISTRTAWNPEMFERMNEHLVGDHSSASADFGYCPRAFVPDRFDLAR